MTAAPARRRWAAWGLSLCAAAVLAGCAGGSARPKPAELPPNAALIGVRQAWTARLPAVGFPLQVNVLGQHVAPTRALIADHPEWNVHDYCKAEVRHDRKMGHITVLTDDTAKTVADLEATGCWDDLKKA